MCIAHLMVLFCCRKAMRLQKDVRVSKFKVLLPCHTHKRIYFLSIFSQVQNVSDRLRHIVDFILSNMLFIHVFQLIIVYFLSFVLQIDSNFLFFGHWRLLKAFVSLVTEYSLLVSEEIYDFLFAVIGYNQLLLFLISHFVLFFLELLDGGYVLSIFEVFKHYHRNFFPISFSVSY